MSELERVAALAVVLDAWADPAVDDAPIEASRWRMAGRLDDNESDAFERPIRRR